MKIAGKLSILFCSNLLALSAFGADYKARCDVKFSHDEGCSLVYESSQLQVSAATLGIASDKIAAICERTVSSRFSGLTGKSANSVRDLPRLRKFDNSGPACGEKSDWIITEVTGVIDHQYSVEQVNQ